jgi:ribose 5-phosphate isomerase A
MTQSRPLSQSELKRLVARAALDYVESGAVLGVGTGSTVDQQFDGWTW